MKEKKNTKKMLMKTALVAVGVVMLGGGTTKAALQANSTTHSSPATKTGAAWISEIRKMEASGQTMGLNESQNADLSPVGTNDIDVHMMRTTEFGAMVILSASGFGNPKKLTEVQPRTTTGNVTGVYLTGDRWEWTAGTTSSAAGTVNKRYYDEYTTTAGDAKVGDGLGLSTNTTAPGCALQYGGGTNSGWHGSGSSYWLNSANCGFRRGGSGAFSFYGYYSWNNTSLAYAGRGVAVVGTGL